MSKEEEALEIATERLNQIRLILEELQIQQFRTWSRTRVAMLLSEIKSDLAAISYLRAKEDA